MLYENMRGEGTGQEGFFLIFRPKNFIFGIYMYFGSNKKNAKKKFRPFLAAILEKTSNQRTNMRADLVRSPYVLSLSFSKRRLTTKLRPRLFSFFWYIKKWKFYWWKKFWSIFLEKKNGQTQKIFIFHFIKKMKKSRGRNLVLSLRFEKLSERTQIERSRSARARARLPVISQKSILSNSPLKVWFWLNLWRNALSKKRVIRKPSKVPNTYFFLHIVLLLYFYEVLICEKYTFWKKIFKKVKFDEDYWEVQQM